MNLNRLFILVLIFFPLAMAAKKRVAGLVIFKRSEESGKIKFLMLKAQKEGKEWSPPKGRIDEGEKDFDAAVRETKEETGYKPADLKISKGDKVSYEQEMNSGKTKEMTFWLAELKNYDKNIRLSDEHSEYRWTSAKKTIELNGRPGFVGVINHFTMKINKYKDNLNAEQDSQ